MRLLAVAAAVAGISLLGSGAAAAAPQATKSAHGTVVAVSGDSVTVKMTDHETKFLVDSTTKVVARGGTTQTRAAQAEGKAGPAIDSILKAGQTVDILYHEPAMHAASIRVVGTAGPAAPSAVAVKAKPATSKSTAAKSTAAKSTEPKAASLFGTVTAMTGTSVTVKGSAGVTTFTVDDKTKVVGTGLGTRARAQAAAGKPQVLADLVGIGDGVTVAYDEMAGAKHAAEVRLRRKAR